LYDLWVITEETNYRDEVTYYLRENPNLAKHMHFFFVPRRKPGGFGRKRPTLPIREILEYRKWLRQSFLIAKTLHSRINFDLVHHLRGNSFREPGHLWQLPVPFVWGPTGGTTNVPWCMLLVLGLKGQCEHIARSIINAFQLRFSRRIRKSLQAAKCVLAQTIQDQENFRNVHGIESIVAHEQASEPSMGTCHTYDWTRKLNVAWIGRCITSKAMPLLLKAVSRPEIKGRIMLHIAGDGSCRVKWQRMAEELGITEQCRWYGWLEQTKTIDMLNSCDVLAFTSLLEATSTAVMQSLSLGVPVICLKRCGLGDVVTEECGFPIPIHNARSAIEGFASAIRAILREPQKLERWSKGALRQADRYSWDNLTDQIKNAYEIALGSSAGSRLRAYSEPVSQRVYLQINSTV
jgi:glycosyltransferase involved in cell wall biosynthesis